MLEYILNFNAFLNIPQPTETAPVSNFCSACPTINKNLAG